MMRSFERHAMILSHLQEHEYASIETMAVMCETSSQTVRRDIRELERDGRVRRYHGGASLAEPSHAANYAVRSTSNVSEKEAAAALVVDLIPDGSSLFIAGGTTLALAAQSLRARENLTIVTNNIHAVVGLFDRPGFEVHVAGGISKSASGSMTGADAVQFIERFKVDYALIGACGIDRDGTLLEYDSSLVQPVLTMMAHSRETILVADSSKFGNRGIVRSAHLRDVDRFVTNCPPTGAFAELLSSHDIDVYHPSSSKPVRSPEASATV